MLEEVACQRIVGDLDEMTEFEGARSTNKMTKQRLAAN